MSRPRAGDWLDYEVAGWKAEGIDLVVNLLEPDEIVELDLQGLPKACRDAGIELVSFPIPDRGVPASTWETKSLISGLEDAIAGGKAVAVHWPALAAPRWSWRAYWSAMPTM